MNIYMQTLYSGFTMGAIYALIGLGISLFYSSSRVLTVDQGEYVMLGGMMMAVAMSLGLPWYYAFILVLILTSLISSFVYKWTVIPTISKSKSTSLLITVAMVYILQGVAFKLWGPTPRTVDHYFGREPLQLFGASVLPQAILIYAVTIAIVGSLYLFLKLTPIGRAFRACAENEEVAQLFSINPKYVWFLSALIKGSIGAIAGIIIMPLTTMSFDAGLLLTLKGIAAAIIGGIGGFSGVIAGGLLLGIFEAYGALFIDGSLKDVLGLVLLIFVLLLRPTGLFGKAGGH